MDKLCLILWVVMFLHTAFSNKDNFATVKWYAICAEAVAMIHYVEKIIG